jgi:hypothetical protein
MKGLINGIEDLAVLKIEKKKDLQYRSGEYVRWHGPGYRRYENLFLSSERLYIPINFPCIGFFLDEIEDVKVEGKEVIVIPVEKGYEEVWICDNEQEAKEVGEELIDMRGRRF